MATFKIGQKGRLVRPMNPENMFAIGTFVGFSGPFPLRGTLCDDGTLLRMDTNCFVLMDGEYFQRPSHTDCWEPLTPPHEAGSWEEIEKLMPSIRELFA
jgi:hypothetical protein